MEIPSGYRKIPIMFLMAEEPCRMDIFLLMPINRKLVQFKKKGDLLSLDDLMKIKSMAESQILMLDSEYESALKSLTDEKLGGDSEIVSESASTMASYVLNNLSTQSSCKEAAATIDENLNVIEKVVVQFNSKLRSQNYDELMAKLSSNDRLSTHNRRVGTLAGIMALALVTWKKEEIADVAFAGFVHDIGLSEISKNLIDQHLNGEVLAIDNIKAPVVGYYRHIEIGLEKIKKMGLTISDNVENIIKQHHENFDGTGLKDLRAGQITKGALLLRIADDLAVIIGNEKHNLDVKSAFQILVEFNKQGRMVYDPNLLYLIQKAMFKA